MGVSSGGGKKKKKKKFPLFKGDCGHPHFPFRAGMWSTKTQDRQVWSKHVSHLLVI